MAGGQGQGSSAQYHQPMGATRYRARHPPKLSVYLGGMSDVSSARPSGESGQLYSDWLSGEGRHYPNWLPNNRRWNPVGGANSWPPLVKSALLALRFCCWGSDDDPLSPLSTRPRADAFNEPGSRFPTESIHNQLSSDFFQSWLSFLKDPMPAASSANQSCVPISSPAAEHCSFDKVFEAWAS